MEWVIGILILLGILIASVLLAMKSATDLPKQPNILQQQTPLNKEKSNLIWKVIFIILFIFDAKFSYWLPISWGFDIYYLTRYSFLLLPVVNLLLFLEIFQKKIHRSFNMRIWMVIRYLLLIINAVLILYSLSLGFGGGDAVMSLISIAPLAVALAITDFVAAFFYVIKEKPQGITRFLLIAFLSIVSFVAITFGVFGFPIIILALLAR